MKISFVTTIYRTAEHIGPFAARAAEAAQRLGFGHEVIFVNDGSPDDGLRVATALAQKDPHIVVVDLSRNYGQHKALWTGLELATGDLVAMLDGDMEEDPMWAVDFHEQMRADGLDVVYGVQEKPKGNILYRKCRDLFYGVLDNISDNDFPRDITTGRLMSRRYVDALLQFQEREIWLSGIMHMAGFRQAGQRVHKPSTAPTKYSVRRLVGLFLMAVTAFSIAPLIGVFFAGIAISIGAFFYILMLLVQYFSTGIGVPGWTSVMAALFMFSGLLLFFNGLIAIYIGTIFLEVKRRPRTLVRSVIGGAGGGRNDG